jgi:hypothetical protein
LGAARLGAYVLRGKSGFSFVVRKALDFAGLVMIVNSKRGRIRLASHAKSSEYCGMAIAHAFLDLGFSRATEAILKSPQLIASCKTTFGLGRG